MALSIGAIIALARALVRIICGNTIYATLTSFKCFTYAPVTALALRTTLAITADPPGFTTPIRAAARLISIAHMTISVSATLLRGIIIAGLIVTALIPGSATAHARLVTAVTHATVGTTAGFPLFTAGAGTTRITATFDTTTVLPGIAAHALATINVVMCPVAVLTALTAGR
jgi:hypothetical protein